MYSEFIHSHSDVIVDRCWYSEMVYGPIVRNEHNMTRVEMYELEKLVVSQGGGMVIHCTANIEKLWERFSKRGDDYIENDVEVLRQIKYKYEYLMHKMQHNIPVFRYEINENLSRL
jgi:thymidylate kinase